MFIILGTSSYRQNGFSIVSHAGRSGPSPSHRLGDLGDFGNVLLLGLRDRLRHLGVDVGNERLEIVLELGLACLHFLLETCKLLL